MVAAQRKLHDQLLADSERHSLASVLEGSERRQPGAARAWRIENKEPLARSRNNRNRETGDQRGLGERSFEHACAKPLLQNYHRGSLRKKAGSRLSQVSP